MTENLTAPSPSDLPHPPSNTTFTPTPTPDEISDPGSGEIRCICECNEDDGHTVFCDKCGTWQHVICMQLPKDTILSEYDHTCTNCSPRPVESSRSRELQRKRRRDEKNNRRKRSTTTSHKKKEVAPSGPNGAATGVAKLPSPREPQVPTSRKRSQRTSHSGGHVHAVGSGTGSPLHFPDRNADAESDTDLDKYKYDFIDISSGQNKYPNEEVRSYLTKAISKNDELFKHYSQKDFPKTSVKMVPEYSKTYSEHPRWCFVLEASCPRGKPMAVFKGEIGFQDQYRNEPINQYALWHHPKPYVLFHPDLPIYIDARRYGSESRFVRRSCRPNLTVKTIVVDNTEVNFGLFAAESIKAGTELTLGWDWNGSKMSQHLAEERFDFSKLTADEMKQAALWVENLLEKMGECACAGGAECLLAKVKKCGGIESVPTKRPVINGHGKKQRTKRNPSSESNPSKEPTPDFNPAHGHDDETKFVVKAKSRSRDLTPSHPHEIAVESGSMTLREARKFKDVLSRIEKQEGQAPPNKRRKRNSTASDLATSATRSASPDAGDTWVTDESRKLKSHKNDSPVMSPASNGREVSVVDASVGRSPGSSTGSHVFSGRSHARSPAASATSSKGRRKVKTMISRPSYVDSSMQTEPGDELPWWKQSVQLTPPRPPRIPLRKRLMQSLLRDQEEVTSADTPVQDQKRKHECFAADTTVPLQTSKVQKTAEKEGTLETPGKSAGPPGAPPIIVKGAASPRPDAGPALENIFADADRHRSKTPQPSNGTDKNQSNGIRPAGLHLSLPSPNVLSDPLSSGHPTPSSVYAQSPLSGVTAPLFSPSVVASVNAGVTAASPSPTKTKKLSLQDYRKRSHKSADATEKKEEDVSTPKGVVDANQAKQLAFLNVLAPADSMPPQATSVDSKIIPASTWGVR
jgi:hypothetical protein